MSSFGLLKVTANKRPRCVNRTSAAGHSGRFAVTNKSWRKFSKSGLKSFSSREFEEHLKIEKSFIRNIGIIIIYPGTHNTYTVTASVKKFTFSKISPWNFALLVMHLRNFWQLVRPCQPTHRFSCLRFGRGRESVQYIERVVIQGPWTSVLIRHLED